jgi:hypothetical protein
MTQEIKLQTILHSEYAIPKDVLEKTTKILRETLNAVTYKTNYLITAKLVATIGQYSKCNTGNLENFISKVSVTTEKVSGRTIDTYHYSVDSGVKARLFSVETVIIMSGEQLTLQTKFI